MDSFFIRENGDKCDVRRVLEPYERLGILNFDLAPGPKYPLQTNWYNQCARLAAVKHSWVAFIDVDEFMVVLNKCAPPPPLLHLHPSTLQPGSTPPVPLLMETWLACAALCVASLPTNLCGCVGCWLFQSASRDTAPCVDAQ